MIDLRGGLSRKVRREARKGSTPAPTKNLLLEGVSKVVDDDAYVARD
jgi:hypothetical protein